MPPKSVPSPAAYELFNEELDVLIRQMERSTIMRQFDLVFIPSIAKAKPDSEQ